MGLPEDEPLGIVCHFVAIHEIKVNGSLVDVYDLSMPILKDDEVLVDGEPISGEKLGD